MSDFISVPLDTTHRKQEFSCGKEMLDTYLHRQAKQDVKRKLSACFVVPDSSKHLIKGYYTLSNNSIAYKIVPQNYRKKLPRAYSSIPTTLLGRLAIDLRYQGQGLGKVLLIDALKRCFVTSSIMGSYAIIVDPIDAEAEAFYEKYGFIKLPDSAKMFIPMDTIKHLFR